MSALLSPANRLAAFRSKACDQVEAVTSENPPRNGYRFRPAPGAAFDKQARRAACHLQCARNARVSRNCRNAVFGFGPRHMGDQPGTGRTCSEICAPGVWDSIQKDMPILQQHRCAVAEMQRPDETALTQMVPFGPQMYAARRAQLIRKGVVAIGGTAFFDARADIWDVKHRRMDARARHHGSGAAVAQDQAFGGQRGHRLVYRHP